MMINSSAITCYAYKDEGELSEISSVDTRLYSLIVSKSLMICAHKSSMLYIVTIEDGSYYLIKFDYFANKVRARVHLQDFVNSKTSFLLLSNTEEHIMVYYSYQAFFYKIAGDAFVLASQRSVQLSAVANLPLGDSMVAKAELSSDVYVISIVDGTILQEMSIQESEYFTNVYTRLHGEQVSILFTDFSNWYAYKLDFEQQVGSKSLVNVYVILMSAFLILVMIISVVYIVQSRKTNPQPSPPTAPQNESQAHILDHRNHSFIPRTLDTNLPTDLTETKVNFLNTEMFRRRFLVCPLTGMVLKDPVVAADGYTYERRAIEQWFEQNSTSPSTHEPVPSKNLIPNTVVASFLPRPNNARNES